MAHLVSADLEQDEEKPWPTWEAVVEGICPAEKHAGEPLPLVVIEVMRFKELERWGYCADCGTCWRARSGGFREADGSPYGRTLDTMLFWDARPTNPDIVRVAPHEPLRTRWGRLLTP